MRTVTFPRGGIHPRERKELTANIESWNAVIPSECIVALQQHIGAPSEPQVGPGDDVREGMLIGKATGFVSANVHSPIPGTVKELREIRLPNGVKTTAIVLELKGEFEQLGKERARGKWESLGREKLLEQIREHGVVGMGGATFPTHVKFSLPKGKSCDFLILNGTECEPYLSADHRLMLERPERLLTGLQIASRVLKPQRVIIAVESNKPDAIARLRRLVTEMGLGFEVQPLAVKYPQGDEKMVIKAITDREVPSGGLPLDIGCVVSNAGTLHAIYEAIVFGKPLIERFVTVSGGAIARPGNLKVRIGTPVGDLIDECGGFSEVPEKLVSGGPMMGHSIADLSTPVTKGTSGILALTAAEVRKSPRTPCIQCGRCVSACPVGLEPTRLFKLVDHFEYDTALSEGLMDCRECGSCSYICPARIPLVQGLRIGKMMARRRKAKS